MDGVEVGRDEGQEGPRVSDSMIEGGTAMAADE